MGSEGLEMGLWAALGRRRFVQSFKCYRGLFPALGAGADPPERVMLLAPRSLCSPWRC